MAAISRDRANRGSKRQPYSNWLEILDKRVQRLEKGADWTNDPVLAFQRCRRFIMKRYPELLRPFSDEAFSRELSRGEARLSDSDHQARILRGLNSDQKQQLAGLLLDIEEALEFYGAHTRRSKTVRKLAAEAPGRTRKLFRKVQGICRKLEELRYFAANLHPTLGLKYVRAAEKCLDALKDLRSDPDVADFFRSQKSEYPQVEHPRQLGIVQLYWFFRSRCGCSGGESEVRVAMIENEILTPPVGHKLQYIPAYQDAESQGSQAVRLAVSRFRPRTTD